MVSKMELGDGRSPQRFLSWLERASTLQHLAWYTRFRAAMELWFYTVCRNDPEYLRVVEELGKPAVREMPQYFSGYWMDMLTRTSDYLGKTYQEAAANDKKRMAQYFTPDSVATMMAQMTLADLNRDQFAKEGGLQILEPACGTGVMVIHAMDAIAKEYGMWGLSRTTISVVDKDILCCWMAAVQLFWMGGTAALAGVNIFHGDSLLPPDVEGAPKAIAAWGLGRNLPAEYVKKLKVPVWDKKLKKVADETTD